MRKKLFDRLPDGCFIPHCIRVYVQKRNPTLDYITVVFTHSGEHSGKEYKGRVVWRGYNDKPFHPTYGFTQWGETELSRFCAGGSRVDITNLPKDTQLCVIQDYASLWNYRCGLVETDAGWRIKEYRYAGMNLEEETRMVPKKVKVLKEKTGCGTRM